MWLTIVDIMFITEFSEIFFLSGVYHVAYHRQGVYHVYH